MLDFIKLRRKQYTNFTLLIGDEVVIINKHYITKDKKYMEHCKDKQ